MIKNWAITGAALAGIVIAPFVFESFTFHLYVIGEPSFFTFSGARLWIFLVSILLSGVVIGLAARLRANIAAGAAGIATLILVAVLYQLCEFRQCYYPGPDGFGEVRAGVLFFSTAVTGIMIGSSRRQTGRKSGHEGLLFGVAASIFLGFFPWALLFASYMPALSGSATLILASVVPFLFAGAVSRLFSENKPKLICSAFSGWLVLAILFGSLRPPSATLLALLFFSSMASALVGFWFASCYTSTRKKSMIIASLLALFALGASHPFIDGPMSMEMDRGSRLLQEPTVYSGAYHNSDTYFSTKRVEIEIDFEQFDPGSVREFLFAGIGVQSPNCCKDGLDYGYRADLYFNRSGTFLAARAWEACDYNIACSGFPWISTMHQSIIPLPVADNSSKRVTVAMEWQQNGRTVLWYYRLADTDWSIYSRFASPGIENPYFNLGAISVGNPLSNPDSGNAYFFQAGVSKPETSVARGTIGFPCLAYFDADGVKNCVDLEPVVRGNSHWKALWKWGIQDTKSLVKTDGSTATIQLG